jgi:gliding motility associated protien GldN
MLKLKLLLSVLCLFLIGLTSQAQEYGEFANDGYDANSVRPVHESNLMFKKTLWLRMSLKEKMNQPFFAKNLEITKLLIDAAKVGIIRPFMNDSMTTRMPHEEFLTLLKIPNEEADLSPIELQIFGNDDDPWDEVDGWDEPNSVEFVSDEYFANQLYILEFKEDLIFDKKRSRMLHDIQAVTIKIPAELNPAGIEKTLATFSYKELVNILFKDNPNAVWYNAKNERYHLNLEDAFDLRLFDAHIIKYDNPTDDYIVDIYGEGKTSVLNSMNYQYNLVEYESNLWEN